MSQILSDKYKLWICSSRSKLQVHQSLDRERHQYRDKLYNDE